ncbi:MAG TPA: hypothetical protein VEY07_07755 [Thermoplasmata archaeon]|nr:hypothetical protein [Thermoplasmata archaeon]
MRRFRTIRQHRRRANKAQVAAVATILGLLLVVTFISQFVLQPLPAQMAGLETEHTFQVENQLSRLQATILAEAIHPQYHLALSSPITLGSQAAPPWGYASPGQILPEGGSVRTVTNYQISHVVPHEPRWNFGSSCLLNGSGKCAGNGNIDTWNVTNQNNSAFTITVNGNRNSIQYNITGNNDTITIDWTGGDTGFVNFIINGSDDHIIYNKGGSDTTTPTANFFFYGQRDIFDFNPSGSHSSKGGMTVNVVFVGTLSLICPYGNLSATDRIGALGTGGSNLDMNVIWWNAVGYTSRPHTIPYPGGSGSNESLTFQNFTGVVGCAFTLAYSTNYANQYGAGILVHLFNTYSPQTDVAYDQGAVVEESTGGSSIMVSPPELIYSVQPQGVIADLTLVDLVGSFSSSGGFETADVTSTVLNVQTLNIQNGVNRFYLSTPLFFNVTTAFPQAWATFFQSAPAVFHAVGCSSSVVIPAPYTCLAPPSGVLTTVSAALSAQGLSVTTIIASVSVV